MWCDLDNGPMKHQKVYPIMSSATGLVLCQGEMCYAAYPRRLMGETCWSCQIIDRHPPATGGDHVQ